MKNTKKIIHPVDENQFINISSPEAAYILGLIWADGTICGPHSVSLATLSIDKSLLIYKLAKRIAKSLKALIEEEIRKCILLCANCHCEKTAQNKCGQGDYSPE